MSEPKNASEAYDLVDELLDEMIKKAPHLQEVLDAAVEMDRWVFQSSGAKRFRRLIADGMPAQRLHDALKALDELDKQGSDNA